MGREPTLVRLVTFRSQAGTRAGRLEDGAVVELDAPDVGTFLASDPDWRTRAEAADGPSHPLDSLELAPPVVRPGKVLCVGLNYESHIREMGREPPDHPTLFTKFAEALVGPRDPIVLPRASRQVDWEGELAFVVGRPVRHATPEEALEAIAGYTVFNDVTARDWQWRTKQWVQGKTFEATTPVGPAVVTGDEVDHARDLEVRCQVDGQLMQQGRTSDLVFPPETIVAYMSTVLTLQPGDLIATGTPSGVGVKRDPPVFLQPGQEVRTSVEGLGELVNRCVAEKAAGEAS